MKEKIKESSGKGKMREWIKRNKTKQNSKSTFALKYQIEGQVAYLMSLGGQSTIKDKIQRSLLHLTQFELHEYWLSNQCFYNFLTSHAYM